MGRLRSFGVTVALSKLKFQDIVACKSIALLLRSLVELMKKNNFALLNQWFSFAAASVYSQLYQFLLAAESC